MRCADCHNLITGEQAKRQAEFWRQPDGEIKVFGHGMPDGEPARKTGQPIAVKHSGCYWSARKREQRAR